MPRNKVFISYSHKDSKYLHDLLKFLEPFIQEKGLTIWDDTKLRTGDNWRKEINAALDDACVAVLLVSPDFIASKFISQNELPNLLRAEKENLLKVCWVLLRPCAYETKGLSKFQAAHSINLPIASIKRKADREQVFTDIAKEIYSTYQSRKKTSKKRPIYSDVQPGKHIFMCYSTADQAQAVKLRDALQERGLNVWDDHGNQISIKTDQAIRRSSAVITLLTKSSYRSLSFRSKVLFALDDARKTVIPLIIEEGAPSMPEIYAFPNIDLVVDWDAGINRLLKTVQANGRVSKSESKANRTRGGTRALKSPDQNPFIFGGAVPADLFVGRKNALRTIQERVGNLYNLQSLSIVSNRRMGKTSLLKYVAEYASSVFSSKYAYAPIYIDAMDAAACSIQGFMSVVRNALLELYQVSSWEEKDDGNLNAFSAAIKRIASNKEFRILLLLDELESIMAHKELDQLLDSLRSFGSLGQIGMITATAYELSKLEAEGKLTSRFSNIFTNYFLGNFSKLESNDLVNSAYARSNMEASRKELDQIFQLAGGHPYLTQLAGSIVWKARQVKTESRSIRDEFQQGSRDIFAGILQRLKDSQIQYIKQAVGMKTRVRVPAGEINELRQRGVLDDHNEIFSASFADYVLENLRNS